MLFVDLFVFSFATNYYKKISIKICNGNIHAIELPILLYKSVCKCYYSFTDWLLCDI